MESWPGPRSARRSPPVRCPSSARWRSSARSARGLDHAHAAGVVHRDLKPENIMLIERDGQRDVVKILDFGIAEGDRASERRAGADPGRCHLRHAEYLSTRAGARRGGRRPRRLYAAGVILYEMLAGRRPFESEDKVKIISMHLAHAPPRVRDVNPSRRSPRARSSRPSFRRWRSRATTGSPPPRRSIQGARRRRGRESRLTTSSRSARRSPRRRGRRACVGRARCPSRSRCWSSRSGGHRSSAGSRTIDSGSPRWRSGRCNRRRRRPISPPR